MPKDFHIIPPKAAEYIRNGALKPVGQMTADEIQPVAISWGKASRLASFLRK